MSCCRINHKKFDKWLYFLQEKRLCVSQFCWLFHHAFLFLILFSKKWKPQLLQNMKLRMTQKSQRLEIFCVIRRHVWVCFTIKTYFFNSYHWLRKLSRKSVKFLVAYMVYEPPFLRFKRGVWNYELMVKKDWHELTKETKNCIQRDIHALFETLKS